MNRGMNILERTALALGFAFLYAPVLLLILYSFNESRLVTVWGGFSFRWYAALWGDEALLQSLCISLRVAFAAAALAVILGAAAALALARFGAFRGRTLFTMMLLAPLAAPEIILGLSLLLLFVALGVPRGFWTIVLSHATMGMCFVAVLVHAKLQSLDPALEEAAMDLGASPLQAFVRVTLPLAAPALFAGYLLAFTLSLDDFVLASFTSGPGSTTLPMRVYSQVRLGVSPEINAISTLMIAAVALMLTMAAVFSHVWRKNAAPGGGG